MNSNTAATIEHCIIVVSIMYNGGWRWPLGIIVLFEHYTKNKRRERKNWHEEREITQNQGNNKDKMTILSPRLDSRV